MKDKIITRLITFLICKRLGLKRFESFRFSNQKSEDIYFFDEYSLQKIIGGYGAYKHSRVSLNFLLSKGCRINKLED